MKWYKHLTSSINNTFIRELLYEFGGDGYLLYFGIMEIYADRYSPEDGWKLNVELKLIREKFLISKSKIKKILTKISQKNDEIYRWEVKIENEEVVVFIPYFAKLVDNYTKNNLQVTCKKLASNLQHGSQLVDNTKVSNTNISNNNINNNINNNTNTKEKEKESIKEKEKENKKANRAPAEYMTMDGVDNIKITKNEYNKLCNEYTQAIADEAIKYLSLYKVEKNYKTNSDYLTIRRWVIDAIMERQARINNLNNKAKTGGIVNAQPEAHSDEIAKQLQCITQNWQRNALQKASDDQNKQDAKRDHALKTNGK